MCVEVLKELDVSKSVRSHIDLRGESLVFMDEDKRKRELRLCNGIHHYILVHFSLWLNRYHEFSKGLEGSKQGSEV